jgi:hypothetical protein
MEDAKMVLRFTTSWVLAAEEGLRAEKTVREIRVDEDVFVERHHVAIVVQCFPVGMSNIFNGKTTGNTAKYNGFIELSNCSRVNVSKRVGSRVGTSTIDNASKGVRIVGSELLEDKARGSQLTVEDTEVFGVQRRGLEVANAGSITSKITSESHVCAECKGLDLCEGAADQPHDSKKLAAFRSRRGTCAGTLPGGNHWWSIVNIMKSDVPNGRQG